MYGPLILAAFEKAGKEIRSLKKYPIAKHLSALLLDQFNEVIGEKMLVNYYDQSRRETGAKFEVRNEIVHALCEYLGFANFEDFRKNYSRGTGSILDRAKYLWADFLGYLRRNWYGLVIVVIVLAILKTTGFTEPGANENVKRFMVWTENHYEEVPYEKLKEYSAEELIDFREDLIRDFKKILSPDCRTEYFDAKGRPLVWYGKNASGELEYFTALAEHPETRKSLDEITRYMIKNHICDTY